MSATALRLAIGAAFIGLVALAAPVHEAATDLEPAVPSALFLIAVVGGVAGHVARHPAARTALLRILRCERNAAGFLWRWGWVLAIVAFLLPLWRHSALKPTTMMASYESLWGRIPWSDAQSHVEGGMQVLATGHMGPYSAKRPLPACLLSVRLALTGRSLLAATSVRAVLLGLAVWLAASALGQRFGVWSGLGFFAVLLGLSRDYIPTELTEPTGLLFASLALAALLMPQARRRAWALGAGLLVFAAGLGARPGPQLLLPFLLVWAVLVGPRPRARTLVTCGLAVALGLLLPRALNRAYGTPESSFDVFSAYTLYGLTRNSNYTQALADFGPELNSIGNEHEVSRFLYRKALEQARREPATLLKALWTNGTRFLIRLPRDLSAVISPRLLIDSPSFRFRRSPRETTWDDMTGGALLALSVAGLAYLFRTRDWDDRSFLLASLMGLTLSAPFVYGNAGFRTLAVGYPFLAAAVGLGLATIRAQAPRSRGRTETGTVAAALLLGLGLIVTGVVGPSVAHWLSPRPELTAVGQSAAEPLSAVVSLAESSTVRVVARQETRESKAHGVGDAMDRAAFLRWIEAAEVPPKAGFDQVRPPFAIISAFDYLNLRQRLLVAPPEMLDAPSGWLSVDLHPLEDNPYLAEVARWQTLR